MTQSLQQGWTCDVVPLKEIYSFFLASTISALPKTSNLRCSFFKSYHTLYLKNFNISYKKKTLQKSIYNFQ